MPHRRDFLYGLGVGLGSVAFSSMLAAEESAPVGKPHLPVKAKRCIFLFMEGGPSHLDTFDPKIELSKRHLQEFSRSGEQESAMSSGKRYFVKSPFEFTKAGECGADICTEWEHLKERVDDICFYRGAQVESVNHPTACYHVNTGNRFGGDPGVGAWVNYGLGTDNQNLPGFVVLASIGRFGQSQPIAARQWHNGFLPGRLQGVQFHAKGNPVLYVGNPKGVDRARQKDVVDTVAELNGLRNGLVDNPEIATRVQAYEKAFQMQRSIPELTNFADEPKHVLDLYGTKGADGTFAANCLMARRLAERGVRFVQLYHRAWDHHGNIKNTVKGTAGEVDRATAALIKDLKQRDMFDDTLIVWGGEFGRTPMAQGSGRDHHIRGFSMMLAGGGIKGGVTHGATDELGYESVEDIVHVNDLHATILHLLGINHKRMTFRFQGRDFRLTDIAGEVVKGVLA